VFPPLNAPFFFLRSQVRGLVVSIQQLSITAGILLAGGLNVGLQHWDEGWRISYGGKGFFSLLLMLLMVGSGLHDLLCQVV
jgi:hypothetical protein